MSVISGLLKVKQIRESARQGDMSRARSAFHEAADTLAQARQLQANRARERRQAEERMYADLCSRVVRLVDIEEANHEVNHMRELSRQDQQQVADAQQHRDHCSVRAEEAEQIWRIAAQGTRKFEYMAEEEASLLALEAERAADGELEEHQTRSVMAEAFADHGEPEAA